MPDPSQCPPHLAAEIMRRFDLTEWVSKHPPPTCAVCGEPHPGMPPVACGPEAWLAEWRARASSRWFHWTCRVEVPDA